MQLVLCAGQPDTPELAHEVTDLVNNLRATRSGVIWIEGMLNRHEVIQLLSHATAFVCPSLYEPLGIVNLEAMACGTAVVASNVGGIPEVVADGETGLLVRPDEPEALAVALNTLARDPERRRALGRIARTRAAAATSRDDGVRQLHVVSLAEAMVIESFTTARAYGSRTRCWPRCSSRPRLSEHCVRRAPRPPRHG